MQTNEHVDLANWLTAVWDEEERLAKKAGGDRWIIDGSIVHENRPHEDVVDWVYDEADEHIAYHDPASVLARIAADRKILAAWLYLAEGTGPLSDELAGQLKAYGWAVQYIAEAHRDRPGFRSEWLVERQGVEQ
jgi:hypothetical protein